VKTLKISDEAHAKLTSLVGRLMAETGKTKTYCDAIEALLSKSVILSQELLDQVESFIKENAQLGYVDKEDFIQNAVRSKLMSMSDSLDISPIRERKRNNRQHKPAGSSSKSNV
jgi:hypothetical protein